jgi:hypothetical protein
VSEPPVETPPPEAEEEAGAAAAPRCWRCGSPHDRFQEYCLECGARLVPLAAARTGWRREMWTRDSPFWFWATFLALLLTALVAGAIVLAATRDDQPSGERRGAGAPPSTSTLQEIPTLPPTTNVTTSPLPDTVTIPPTTSPVPTLPPATPPPSPGATPTPPPTPGATPTPPPAGGTGSLRSWPSGKRGYTIILTSVPHGQGRAAAEQRGREAQSKGVNDVGVLDSSDYSSLRAGYYVVFAGVHDTEAQAVAQLPSVRQAGYPVAYVREIAA